MLYIFVSYMNLINFEVSVKFNGESIPGSPMRCAIGDTDTTNVETVTHVTSSAAPTSTSGPTSSLPEIQLIGDLSSAQVNHIKGFTIDTEGRAGDCNVIITGMSFLTL